MHKYIKIVTLTLLLIQIVVLSSCSFAGIMRNIGEFPLYNLLISKILVISEVKPPDIPHRPSLNKLRETLDEVVASSSLLLRKKIVGKENVANHIVQHSTQSTTESTLQFTLSPDLLFSSLIEAVMSLKLSVKSLDVVGREIVLLDKLRNRIVISIIDGGSNSLVKVIGYQSIFGALSYKRTIDGLLEKINNLENRVHT